jgi:hypothetical protein
MIGDLLLYAVSHAARRLHDPPMRGHGLLAADHHRLVEVGIDDFVRSVMPFMETVFQASARHSSSLPVHLIHGSVGDEFFLFFLPFDVGVDSGADTSQTYL